ncbi:MAG: cellulose synthase [Mesorhizobium sp.]
MSARSILGAIAVAGLGTAGWMAFGNGDLPIPVSNATMVTAQNTTAPAPSVSTPAPTTPPPEPQQATEQPAAQQQPAVDETALRYFARQGDTKRLQAEIARLRALYPSWTPPADPAAAPVQKDTALDSMWQLYAQGKYAEARQAIADRQSQDANWQPPKDLLDRLSVAEARERLVNASDLKQYATVIRVAASAQSLLTCSDLDVLWRVAEAFAKTNEVQRADDAYQYVLRNCTDPAERLATMQKALGLLPRDKIDGLLALEKTGKDGTGEFAAIRADIIRQSVAAGATEPPQPVPERDVAALEELATTGKSASDARLLGWYYLRKDDPTNAQKWFTSAREIADDAETSEGLGLALIALEKPRDAEEILYKWQDSSDGLRKVYLAAAANLVGAEPRVPIDEAVLKRLVPVVAAAKDAATAQQLGWYAHAFGQEETAVQWFTTALRWKPDDEAAAYGLAVVRLALGDKKGVMDLQREWADRSERIATITDPQVKTAAVELARRAAASRAATGEVAITEPQPAAPRVTRPGNGGGGGASATGGTALARAWRLMELNRPIEAVDAFEVAIRGGDAKTRAEAAWGQSLANIRLGLPDQAAVSASKAPQSGQRARDLEASILSLRATGFFERKRYAETLLALDQRARIAPERRDLMVLRGYAYLALWKVNEARQVFEAIAATGDAEGPRGLAAVREKIDPTPQP